MVYLNVDLSKEQVEHVLNGLHTLLDSYPDTDGGLTIEKHNEEVREIKNTIVALGGELPE